MAPKMTFDILRPESPRLRKGLAGAMGARGRKAIAHRVYSMVDANLLLLNRESRREALEVFV